MEVTLQDVYAEQIAKGIAAQKKLFSRKFKTQAQRDGGQGAADRRSDGRRASRRADVVIEAIVEKLEVKQKPLQVDIEGKLKPGAILATNTSSIRSRTSPRRSPIPAVSSASTSSTRWRRCRWWR